MDLQLHVPTIACEGCAETITKAVKSLDASARVSVDLSSKMVMVDSQTPESDLKNAIVATGHTIA